MLSFERLTLDAVDWEQLDSFPDRTIFQTLPWLTFVARTQQAEPVVAALRDGTDILGYFTGLIVKKCGCKILGSPFRGWSTSYMGLNLVPGISRRQALAALVDFAFRELHCVHLELMDRRLTGEDGNSLGFVERRYAGFEINLCLSEDELSAAMTSACRRCIRKSEKEGVIIEEAHDGEFADDYYAQLKDVFAKQRLIPTYNKERVHALIDCLHPSGMLLLLRARDDDGRCIASGIFPAMNDTMYFWGGASWRQYQILRPNEAIQWHAMQYWKARGIQHYDMGGGGEYKRKYGGREICVPWFRKSKYRFIASLRVAAQELVKTSQQISGFMDWKP
jgi:CelD/BcsL family acetyltransferase involved in cellulose biosynthesis